MNEAPQWFRFNDRDIPFRPGQSVAAALLEVGVRSTRQTRRSGAPRGLFCGIGVCYDCLAVVDGVPDRRTCRIAAVPGMVVRRQLGAEPPIADDRARTTAAQATSGPLTADVAIVGAGPAGMAAAVAAAAAGARVVVLDAEHRIGGQFWRHGPDGPGDQHHRLGDWHRLSAGLQAAIGSGQVRHLARHRVWRVDRDLAATSARLVVHAVADDEAPVAVVAGALVLATGAQDLALPVPGWQLPGVFTAGGAQALLKEHDVLPGRRVVVGGTGPFLLSLAAGLAEAGCQVTLAEAADGRGWLPGWRAVLGHAGVLREGAGYAAVLARHRVPVHPRTAVVAIEPSADGEPRVAAAVLARLDGAGRPIAGSERRIECDAVALGWGFTPRLELAAQLGARLVTSGPDAGNAVIADVHGGIGVPGVFVAGELTGVGGAELAQLSGGLAGAAAAAQALGGTLTARPVTLTQRRRLRGFAAAMRQAHPVPVGWTAWLADDTVICRCEEVPAAALREAVAELAAGDARSVRLLTRCGMGWCQGRICGEAVHRLVAAELGASPNEVGQLGAGVHGRPVAEPVPLGLVATLTERSAPVDEPGRAERPGQADTLGDSGDGDLKARTEGDPWWHTGPGDRAT